MDRVDMHDLIVDDRVRGIFRVNRRVFTDPEILERERREVFDRSWLYAGHESEIGDPGDYVTRRVGGRPLILVRDDAGAPHAFLNTCPHRGNTVCRERAGSTRLLRCFYHAWAFDLTGRLAGVPDDDAYTPAFDRDALGLKPVPRLESYRGMMFVSYDPEIESLVGYLGNARDYLDLMLDFGGDEVEIVPGSQAYSMKANWKLLVENSVNGSPISSSRSGMPRLRRTMPKSALAASVNNTNVRSLSTACMTRSGCSPTQPSEPKPPPAQTAAASSTVPRPAIGASTSGCSIPRRSIRRRSGHIDFSPRH